MEQWQYAYVHLPHDRTSSEKVGGDKVEHLYQIEAILNAYGQQGWEAVGIAAFTGKGPATFLLNRRVG